MRAVSRLVRFTLAFALQLRKITESLRVAEKAPVGTFRRRHLVSAYVCQAVHLTDPPHPLTCSRIFQRSDVAGVEDSQIVENLPVTNVPGCIGSNAKTFGLQYLQFLDMGAGSGPPDGTRVVPTWDR